MKIPDIIPVTDLRQNAASVLKKLRSSAGPLVITQRGRAIAVIQSVDAYEKSEHERELLSLLATGEEIAEGEGHTLASVLKEADALLGRRPVKVKFTPSARTQFLEGLEYIRQDSPSAALCFREKAEQVLRRLEKFPESGRSIPEFPGFPSVKSSSGHIGSSIES